MKLIDSVAWWIHIFLYLKNKKYEIASIYDFSIINRWNSSASSNSS